MKLKESRDAVKDETHHVETIMADQGCFNIRSIILVFFFHSATIYKLRRKKMHLPSLR